jgi:hypothetical protein
VLAVVLGAQLRQARQVVGLLQQAHDLGDARLLGLERLLVVVLGRGGRRVTRWSGGAAAGG